MLFIPRLCLTLFFSPTPTPLRIQCIKVLGAFLFFFPRKDLKNIYRWLPCRSCLTLSYSTLTLLSSCSSPYPGITYRDMGNTCGPSTLFSYFFFFNPWQPPLALLPSFLHSFFYRFYLFMGFCPYLFMGFCPYWVYTNNLRLTYSFWHVRDLPHPVPPFPFLIISVTPEDEASRGRCETRGREIVRGEEEEEEERRRETVC